MSAGLACVEVASGSRVLPRSATGAAHGPLGSVGSLIVLGIGNPGLERSPGPGTNASAQMNRRRKTTDRDPPIERRSRQGRHFNHVSDAVKRRDDVGCAASFAIDRSACIHRRMAGDVLSCAPGLRRRLRALDRLALPWWRVNPKFCANHATTSDRRQLMARPLSLSFFENLPIRHSPAITQRSRRVSRATSWVHKSSCSGG
jgi:hypothetical protein